MTTNVNPNPSEEPAAFPPKPTQAPTTPGLPEKEGDKRVDQVADRLAHKAAKTEQGFDTDNNKLFNK